MSNQPIRDFIEKNFRHFNAAALVDAAHSYEDHINGGGKMIITLAGAMSTAELGITLAEMIRRDKVHLISCTGANLEEDVFNLVAHSFYKRIPQYRDLSPQDEEELLNQHYNRVTDTCIPEMEAMRRIEKQVLKLWKQAADSTTRYFPHEYLYKLLLSGELEEYYEIDPKNSWLLAAAQKNIPLIVPGWEDSTLGNMFAAHCMMNHTRPDVMKNGIEYMITLADWYRITEKDPLSPGFYQIGGGIAGDFPICVVPMLHQDMEAKVRPWGYFCQISDSTTSYGSYSGAVPNEKITWGKLEVSTPKFIIESDATIVAPLMFAMILGM